MKAVNSVKEKKSTFNHLIVTDVKREDQDDERISLLVVYQLVKNENDTRVWLKRKDQTRDEIAVFLLKGWTVQTGKVLSDSEMDIGENIEIELRVRKNNQKYPLNLMGRS